MLKTAFNLARSWQKGQQYTRDAHLKEQRTLTERAREQQIMADVDYKRARTAEIAVDIELKKARTLLIKKMADTKDNDGFLLWGCSNCDNYDVRENAGDNCNVCGQPYTHNRINLK